MSVGDLDPWRGAFNTWDNDYPVDFTCPSQGLRIGFACYSDAGVTFTRFAAPLHGVRLGARHIDGASVATEVTLEGTRLALDFARPASRTLLGRWRVLAHGEWGLRFWPIVWCEWEHAGEPVQWQFDPATGALTAAADGTAVAVVMEQPPLLVTMHDGVEALAAEMRDHGYWHLASRANDGALPALRCNLEEMPSQRWAVAIGATPDEATALAREALDEPPCPAHLATDGPLDAIRDVVGWNTVFDRLNQRRYTALSRNWSTRKFGGFGVWLDDVFYHALLAGLFDPDLAADNLRAIMDHATPAGNFACLVTGHDAWVDRSQPPIGAFVVWMLHQRHPDAGLLELCYDALAANHRWWWKARDGNGNGLLEYGSSDVGSGLYKGTALGARDESSMDNSPTHDEARFDPVARTLDCEDVGLNALVALDGEMLATCARALGRETDAAEFDQRASTLRSQISEQLWDDARGVFANRLWSGEFVRSLAPTSFYPLLAGAATTEQADALLGWLRREDHFGGDIGLPSVSRDDPAFTDNVYWRGRAWPPLNFLVYYGLRRYGFDADADALARRSEAMFEAHWRERRICAENYNATSGQPDDQPDTDTFYGWGALLPWLGMARRLDVDPFDDGVIVLVHDGEDFRMGPVPSVLGPLTASSSGGQLTLECNGEDLLETTLRGRYRITRQCVEVKCDAPDGEQWCSCRDALTADADGVAIDGERRGDRPCFVPPVDTGGLKILRRR